MPSNIPQLRDLAFISSPPNEGVILWNVKGESESLCTWRDGRFLSDSERLLLLMEPARSSAYDRLAEYINRRMRMSHIYQPLMLMELLIVMATMLTLLFMAMLS